MKLLKRILLFGLFTAIISSCQTETNAKIDNETELNITKTLKEKDTPTTTQKEIEPKFSYGFNAEVNHIMAIPFNLIELETSQYDSTIHINNDSSLHVTKWVYLNFLDHFDYPLTELNDIDLDKIDTLKINELYINACNQTLTELGDGFNILERSPKELIIENTLKEPYFFKKFMLCNVVGGTHAIVAITVKFNLEKRSIAERIVKESKPK